MVVAVSQPTDSLSISRTMIRMQVDRLEATLLGRRHQPFGSDKQQNQCDIEFLLDSLGGDMECLADRCRDTAASSISEHKRRCLVDSSREFRRLCDSVSCLRQNIEFFGLGPRQSEGLVRWLLDFRHADHESQSHF